MERRRSGAGDFEKVGTAERAAGDVNSEAVAGLPTQRGGDGQAVHIGREGGDGAGPPVAGRAHGGDHRWAAFGGSFDGAGESEAKMGLHPCG